MNPPLDMLQIKIDRAREALPKSTKKAIDSVDWRAVILSFREKKGYSFEQLEDLELETELLLCGLLEPVDYPKRLEEEMKLPKAQVDLLVQEMNQLVFEKIKGELIKNTERESIFVKKETEDILVNKIDTNSTNKNINPNVVGIDKHIISPNIITAKGPISISELRQKENIPDKKIEDIKKVESPITISKNTEIEILPKEIVAPSQNGDAITKTETGVLNKAGIDIINTNEPKINQNIPTKALVKEEVVKTEPIFDASSVANAMEEMDSISSQKLSGSFQLKTTKTQYSLPSIGKNKVEPSSLSKIASSKDPYREIPE